jgi:hypothetical protein
MQSWFTIVNPQLLRQTASVLGIVVLSVTTTLIVQRFLAPSPAAAQVGQLEEISATRFTLVGADGTILARLEPGNDANARLQLFNNVGVLRVGLTAQGAVNIFDVDGTTQRFRAGFVPYTDGQGRPPINGVWLDGDGSIGPIP